VSYVLNLLLLQLTDPKADLQKCAIPTCRFVMRRNNVRVRAAPEGGQDAPEGVQERAAPVSADSADVTTPRPTDQDPISPSPAPVSDPKPHSAYYRIIYQHVSVRSWLWGIANPVHAPVRTCMHPPELHVR
jgi:hypothetical protein